MTPRQAGEVDRRHLLRCIELAREALQSGDQPFGSVLVGQDGNVLREDRNRTSEDPTHHPELALIQWAARNLDTGERRQTTLYTSGEHCPMCSAAHGWAGMGRLVFVHSTDQLTAWKQTWGVDDGPVAQLSSRVVLRGDVAIDGPFPEFADEMKELHREAAGLDG